MASFHHTIVVSPVGTSLLTNGADGVTVSQLQETANLHADSFSRDVKMAVEAHISRVRADMGEVSQEVWRQRSAELNGVLSLEAFGAGFSHFLICTDTLQGRATGEIVKTCLERAGVRSAEIFIPSGLSTASQEAFNQGIDALLLWCEENLKWRRDAGERVIFNLVGGFKSIQAYLQTLGMVYADEICYLFEGKNAPLLRIPRLPVLFDKEPLLKHRGALARLAARLEPLSLQEASGIPEAYLEIVEEMVGLSHWGTLAWNAEKASILSEELIEHEGLAFAASFVKDYDRYKDTKLRTQLQEDLAKVAVLWKTKGVRGLREGSLQYSPLEGHRVDHFRVGIHYRVTCMIEGQYLMLRRFGTHEVEDNP